MTTTLQRTIRGAAAAGGPLLFLEDARRVALGEWVVVRVPGQADRRGQVIEAGERVTVIVIAHSSHAVIEEQPEAISEALIAYANGLWPVRS